MNKVFCINLPEDIEKRLRMKKKFRDWNIDDVTFIDGLKASHHSEGCWLAHLSIYKRALDQGEPYITIFEDDACQSKKLKEKDFLSISKIIQKDKEWRVIMLGYDPYIFVRWKTKDGLHRIRSQRSHAYIISKKGMKEMLRSRKPTWFHIGAIDTYFLVSNGIYTLPGKMKFKQEEFEYKEEDNGLCSKCITYSFVGVNILWWDRRLIIIFGFLFFLIIRLLNKLQYVEYTNRFE